MRCFEKASIYCSSEQHTRWRGFVILSLIHIFLLEQGNTKLKGYQEHLSILCIMDTGNGAAFIYRDSKKEIMIPLPVFGHWVKQAWGHYAKAVKLGKFPQII